MGNENLVSLTSKTISGAGAWRRFDTNKGRSRANMKRGALKLMKSGKKNNEKDVGLKARSGRRKRE